MNDEPAWAGVHARTAEVFAEADRRRMEQLDRQIKHGRRCRHCRRELQDTEGGRTPGVCSRCARTSKEAIARVRRRRERMGTDGKAGTVVPAGPRVCSTPGCGNELAARNRNPEGVCGYCAMKPKSQRGPNAGRPLEVVKGPTPSGGATEGAMLDAGALRRATVNQLAATINVCKAELVERASAIRHALGSDE